MKKRSNAETSAEIARNPLHAAYLPAVVNSTEAAIALAKAFEKAMSGSDHRAWLRLALISALKARPEHGKKSKRKLDREADELMARSPLTVMTNALVNAIAPNNTPTQRYEHMLTAIKAAIDVSGRFPVREGRKLDPQLAMIETARVVIRLSYPRPAQAALTVT